MTHECPTVSDVPNGPYGLRSLKVDFIDSKFNPGRPDCPNVIRVPAKEGGSGAGAKVGLRSLVCARKVDLIGSSFDRGRATGGPTVTRVPVEGVGGKGVSEGGLRSLDSALIKSTWSILGSTASCDSSTRKEQPAAAPHSFAFPLLLSLLSLLFTLNIVHGGNCRTFLPSILIRLYVF
jgi:hypothetical protein